MMVGGAGAVRWFGKLAKGDEDETAKLHMQTRLAALSALRIVWL